MTDSAGNTLTVNSKTRLGLLLRQYYDDPAGLAAAKPDYSLARLKKMKTEPLMARAVESLRSYKEAESDLRMLLYNNCDNLLKAVQVVCTIREGSHGLVDDAARLGPVSEKLVGVDVEAFTAVSAQMDLAERIEALTHIPVVLKDSSVSVEERVKTYLRVNEDVFATATVGKYPLVQRIAAQARSIVEEELVPALMSEATTGGDVQGSLHAKKLSRVNLLMDLFPSGHAKHEEVMQQFVELEIAGLEDRLVGGRAPGVVKLSETLGVFNSLINVWFLLQDVKGDTSLSDKVRDVLLPTASEHMLDAICSDDSVDVDSMQAAINAHLRVPRVSKEAIARFTASAVKRWIVCKFRGAARICVNEDLGSLLAASAFGACCDVTHTRCCTVVVAVNEFLSSAEFVADPSDFFSHTVEAICGYYETVAVPPSAASLSHEEQYVHLIKVLKMNKFMFNRKTIERSVNALVDIFGCDDEVTGSSQVIPGITLKVVKLLGEWTGCDHRRLQRVIEDGLGSVLDSAVVGPRVSLTSAAAELASTESVHARKLLFSGPTDTLVSIERAAGIVTCIYLRAVREASLSGDLNVEDWRATVKQNVLALVEKHVRGQDLYDTVQAMLRDVPSADV